MFRHNSVRIFLDQCPLCNSLGISFGAWKINESENEAGILHVYAFCTNASCGYNNLFEMQPDATGCRQWDREDLQKLKLSGTPYTVADCGVMPNSLGDTNNRQQ